MNMQEQIMAHLEAIKENELVSLIDDCFYKEELDRGMIFQVRRSNFLNGKRSLNIIDEIEEREKI